MTFAFVRARGEFCFSPNRLADYAGQLQGFIGADGKSLEVLMQLEQLKSLMKGRAGP